MRSIGEMARDSELGVSALRFYDRAGVLAPARVDPASGYRWYAPEQLDEARVLARLRRAGMPLADIRLVLAGWSGADPDLVRRLLQAHLRRLERGLAEARSEFSTLRALLDHRENPMTASPRTDTVRLSLGSPELAGAIDAVRFAVGKDPELPMLGGVLFDVDGDTLHVVATDRYRMAVARMASGSDSASPSPSASASAGHGGPREQVVVPAPLVDAMRALLGSDEPAGFAVEADRVTLEAGERQASGQRLAHDFPDYRRLVQLPAGRRVVVDVPALREALETGPVRTAEAGEPGPSARDVSVLATTDDGTVTVVGDGDADGNSVGVDRGFLLDALAAADRDRLVLEFGAAPTAPLAIRRTDDEGTFSLLMPVRLDS
ncbi:DNA polymerase III subunit beta family protein [Streptomyces coelicoflavus]|uniref:DNA polymerase III subunit beta family protein n=1 Tax=Streptomyces coelicoflavus TaxID=285562 RepID=UPI00225C2706|nr:MerR family transcriptional regulator [Streptomyces coelicoflavus]MCX5039255.1 MerR family transcriptional regulator [Streptomyces coelicoflavus]